MVEDVDGEDLPGGQAGQEAVTEGGQGPEHLLGDKTKLQR